MSEKRELAQRCRPSRLDEIWGNTEMVKSLRRMLENPARPQTYLFCGPAGTGKTTAARVFCNELGVSELNLTEYNASDKNGVDDIRGIIDDMQYSVFGLRAVIFDECHMWSASAMSAILKMLEEPPKDTYFFLCTTNPEKLTQAVKSRCETYQTRTLDERTMIKSLRNLCGREGIEVSIDVLETIAEKSEGCPRYALKLLDKVEGLDDDSAMAVLSAEKTMSEDVSPAVKDLCRMVMDGKTAWKDIAAVLRTVKGSDIESFRRGVLGYLNAVLLNSGSYAAANAISYFAQNFFDSGFAGLTLACWQSINSLKGCD